MEKGIKMWHRLKPIHGNGGEILYPVCPINWHNLGVHVSANLEILTTWCTESNCNMKFAISVISLATTEWQFAIPSATTVHCFLWPVSALRFCVWESSLILRLLVGGRKEPGIHCSRMLIIITCWACGGRGTCDTYPCDLQCDVLYKYTSIVVACSEERNNYTTTSTTPPWHSNTLYHIDLPGSSCISTSSFSRANAQTGSYETVFSKGVLMQTARRTLHWDSETK